MFKFFTNQQNNPNRIFSLIFVVVGVFMMIIASMLFVNYTDFNENSKPIEAVVSNIAILKDKNSKEYRDTLVDYCVDDQSYKNISINEYSSNIQKYDTVKVFYNIKNPNMAYLNLKAFNLPIFLVGIGIMFFISALLAIRKLIKREDDIANLLSQSNFVLATVIKHEFSTSAKIGGKKPSFIVCQHEHNNEIIQYESDYIWDNVDLQQQGQLIPVFLDQNNPKKYYVDIRKFAQR